MTWVVEKMFLNTQHELLPPCLTCPTQIQTFPFAFSVPEITLSWRFSPSKQSLPRFLPHHPNCAFIIIIEYLSQFILSFFHCFICYQTIMSAFITVVFPVTCCLEGPSSDTKCSWNFRVSPHFSFLSLSFFASVYTLENNKCESTSFVSTVGITSGIYPLWSPYFSSIWVYHFQSYSSTPRSYWTLSVCFTYIFTKQSIRNLTIGTPRR